MVVRSFLVSKYFQIMINHHNCNIQLFFSLLKLNLREEKIFKNIYIKDIEQVLCCQDFPPFYILSALPMIMNDYV